MAKSKNNAKKVSYISVPSQVINSLSSSSLQTLLLSPKKPARNRFLGSYRSPKLWFSALFLFGFLGMIKLWFNLDPSIPCLTQGNFVFPSNDGSRNGKGSISDMGLVQKIETLGENAAKDEGLNRVFQSELQGSNSDMGLVQKIETLGANGVKDEDFKRVFQSELQVLDRSDEKELFWKQPDGLGYKPCLEFSRDYRRGSEVMVKDRRKYLIVVVAGGMNQQRNQIVDAVVIARILGAALVVPILQVNVIWGDESEFSDIFDLEHFKKVLAKDVRIVSSLPSTHIRTRPVEEKQTPLHVSPQWIRARYLKRLHREGVLLLRGLDSRLSKDLPSDLQKLRCKVAFEALKFVPTILELGNKLVERMHKDGPYLALHLRMEKDVWVRTGCLPGLTSEYDEMIDIERKRRPELLTGRSNMTYHERKLAGLCPLNALEVTRLLKALGAPSNARIYLAGGQPLGGKEALLPLSREFPHLYKKEDLTLPGELEPFMKKASLMAAIDYIVSERSDVFMASHGGNMGHAIQGNRAYAGHKKFITPNKRHMLPYFLDSSLPEGEFNTVIKHLHSDSLGQPELRTSKDGRDVTKYPIPECMCNSSRTHSSF
ncbi:O-fucosyltransferase family protein [Euphorbia peplus]|nr:O-fucosyltransferase family protein [Euphorbia peplus]